MALLSLTKTSSHGMDMVILEPFLSLVTKLNIDDKLFLYVKFMRRIGCSTRKPDQKSDMSSWYLFIK